MDVGVNQLAKHFTARAFVNYKIPGLEFSTLIPIYRASCPLMNLISMLLKHTLRHLETNLSKRLHSNMANATLAHHLA